MKRYVVLLFIIAMMASCHHKQPSGVLSESNMQKVLYEYHLSKAMAYQTDRVEYYKRYYFLEVLKKHKLSEESFEKSLLWYSQHTDLLYKIYENINKKLKRESMALGVVTSDTHYYSSLSNKGDTANIWSGRSFYLLSPVGVNNRFSFRIDADSTSRPKDVYLLHMTAKYVYAEGQRDAMVNLSVTYVDDSVQSVHIPIHGDGEFRCELNTVDKNIKYVQGIVFLKGAYSERPKLLFIMQPAMIRFHHKEKETGPKTDDVFFEMDSVRGINKDSLAATRDVERIPRLHAKPIPLRKSRRIP